MSKAEDYFAADHNARVKEEWLVDALLTACDIGPQHPDDWPLDDITFDDYDYSFEFRGVAPGWAPTSEQMMACFALGFARCWICYTDGMERYYAPGFMGGELRDAPAFTRAASPRRKLATALAQAAENDRRD